MLGSLADAEDAVQDAFERALRGAEGFEGRASVRTWLYRIVTNVCLNERGTARRRGMPFDLVASPGEAQGYERLPDGAWIDPAPASLRLATVQTPEATVSSRESTSLAFVAALQRLTEVERAALLLRDVVGLSADETATALERSTAAVNSALERARARVRATAVRPVALERLDADDHARLRAYVAAWEQRDPDAIAALLARDVVLSMPPLAQWIKGRDGVAALLPTVLARMGEPRIERVEISGAPGLALWGRERTDAPFRPFVLMALTATDAGIATIDAFMLPALFARFGLPDEPPSISR